MSIETASQGSLFTSDFMTESIQDVSEWNALGDADLDQFGESIRGHFDQFPNYRMCCAGRTRRIQISI